MQIQYKYVHDFERKDLQELFLSVKWESGAYPDKLVAAMKNYSTVISAWDGEKLVGMVCAMDDGVITAYVHYLLVDPSYQKLKIGRTLMELTKERYKDYLSIVLIAYSEKVGFYESCGFSKNDAAIAMKLSKI